MNEKHTPRAVSAETFYAGEFSNLIFIRKYISRVNMQPYSISMVAQSSMC